MNFVKELNWRGMVHNIMPETEEVLNKGLITGYVGFDPTASSLTVGNLVPIMLLVHFQRAGHIPIALVGGATGMIGDPSGKSEERTLLGEEELDFNLKGIEKQLRKLLDFDSKKNPAVIVNNYDWFKDIAMLNFLRDVGKYLTVRYLLSKGFVKDRMQEGVSFENPFAEDISFTEFNYILMQAYDFYWLFENKNCTLQMGGSDQWGNITAGVELIRKKLRKSVYGLTCPLLTKSDGTKFGKTEEGNIWLDPNKTSPYKFYQFWLNSSDEDASKYIRIFSIKNREEIESIESDHLAAPHERLLQKELAREITVRVHSESAFKTASTASDVLFGKGTAESLKMLSEKTLLDIFEGVPQSTLSKSVIEKGIGIVDFLAVAAAILPSKAEARRMLNSGGISINKTKVSDENRLLTAGDLLNNKYILVQKGKKNYHLVHVY